MARLRMIGVLMLLAGGSAIVVGSLGRWVNGEGVRESDVVNAVERRWMVGAGVALLVVGATLARGGLRLGWIRVVAWLHAALVVGVSTLDAGKKIGSSRPDVGDRLGWGLWLACAGVAVGMVGVVLANSSARSRGTTTGA